MANIRVDINYPIQDGTEIVFRSPVDCTEVTGLIVYYLGEDGDTTSKEFAFADAHGNNVGDIPHLFAENVVVKVILDITSGMAFVQNADTNAYLEGRFEKLLPKTDLTTAINTALAQAKTSGEFDGKDGITPSVTVTSGKELDGRGNATIEVKYNLNGIVSTQSATVVDGKDGYIPIRGVDYFTEEDKAELIAGVSQIEAPKIVSSVAEMTDPAKHYVLNGYIYSQRTVEIPGETIRTYPNQFVPSAASLNSRLSGSSGSVVSRTGYFVTDFIAVKNFTGVSPYNVRLNWAMTTANIDCKVVFYNSSKTRCGDRMIQGDTNTSVSGSTTVIDLCLGTGTTAPTASDVAYVKLQLCISSSATADSQLTSITSDNLANLEITFDAIYTETATEPTITTEWVNSGITYAPTFKTDLVGVLGDNNVIYLSENLPSGTYTLKYGDETYDTIGTITVE